MRYLCYYSHFFISPYSVIGTEILAKNHKTAEPSLPPKVAELLAAWKSQNDFDDEARVFPNVKYRLNVAELVRQDLEAAGLKVKDFAGKAICFHSLRNSYISFLANENLPFKAVQTLSRHSDPKLTYNVYAKLFKETERAAVSALPPLDFSNFTKLKPGAIQNDEEKLCHQLCHFGVENQNQPEKTGDLSDISVIHETGLKLPNTGVSSALIGNAEGGNRTHTLSPGRDFESRASANSATSAFQVR
jgi:hypothetical protein